MMCLRVCTLKTDEFLGLPPDSYHMLLCVSRACSGEPVPDVEYTPEEVAVWGHVLRELKGLFPRHACRQFNEALPKLDFREDKVCAWHTHTHARGPVDGVEWAFLR